MCWHLLIANYSIVVAQLHVNIVNTVLKSRHSEDIRYFEINLNIISEKLDINSTCEQICNID